MGFQLTIIEEGKRLYRQTYKLSAGKVKPTCVTLTDVNPLTKQTPDPYEHQNKTIRLAPPRSDSKTRRQPLEFID